jgi:DNA polymerase III alpha subunit
LKGSIYDIIVDLRPESQTYMQWVSFELNEENRCSIHIAPGCANAFLTLEDETDIYECVLFPEAFQKYGDLLLWENLFILRGKVEESFGVISITIEKLGSLPKMFRLNHSGSAHPLEK